MNAPRTGALAARCTACSTVFRVVPDQLRVSEGWVRCGRCAEVFNASENLIDLDTGEPRRLPQVAAPAAQIVASVADMPAQAAKPAAPAQALAGALPAWADALPPMPSPAAAPVAAPVPAPPPPPPADSAPLPFPPTEADAGLDMATTVRLGYDEGVRIEPFLELPASPAGAGAGAPASPAGASAVAGAGAHAAPRSPVALPEPAPAKESTPLPAAEPAAAKGAEHVPSEYDSVAPYKPDQPSFVRQAERAARWRRPQVRAGLGLVVGLAALSLLLQVLFQYRDLVAARWAVARPALVAGCQLVGCQVGPARSIDGLAVESSGLVRVEKTNLYTLSVGLRNRSGIELAVPVVELSLTDTQGQLLARRVLSLPELGVNQPTLAAGRELALLTTLQAAPLSTVAAGSGLSSGVAGYTIELFYP